MEKLRTSSSADRPETRIFEECGKSPLLCFLAIQTWLTNFTSTTTLNEPSHLPLFPDRFQPIITEDLNGSFDCEDIPDEAGQFIQHRSWSTYKIKRVVEPHKYHWTQATCYVHWDPTTSHQTVYCIDLPLAPRTFLKSFTPPARRRAHDPYAWHAAFATALIPEYDRSIWGLRDLVREIEKGRLNPTALTPNFFPHLHDIARHIFHANETLEVAQHTVESLVREQIRSAGLYTPGTAAAGTAAGIPNPSPTPSYNAPSHYNHNHSYNHSHNHCAPAPAPSTHLSTLQTERALRALAKQLHALHTRSRSLTERLHNEINLGFNLVSQQFGHDTKSDSAMMKTIAVVSMVYLPGTFVSGLFGTNFFNFTDGDEHTWFMAGSFWLYWAVTIPLTLATMAVWAWWHYFLPAKRRTRKMPVRQRVETV
ncbi:hypothetical protein ASPACDRAFT_43766 [Aspergillus aculeatus ATCC 16872]|uniref:Uncharacterized protein n=1 Tax=Aspergillus aculeatus (strain ATCC 16872 / CBS 172.66 / WB 5094) TaxID=690307 RepID=A0A1L9WSC3_ASPA1|nr:uncharacterized protein ASPACDRAFT_43766 [Aspergillus aculeatus ATCC 16872]OJJ99106.1 hypothetical protein ASPACDRAFT_43766 [Aspergillus aculeatus ATCC 16872]